MDLQAFRTLSSPDQRALLDETCAAYDEKTEIALSRRLRRDHPAELVIAAMAQASLRRKAQPKFRELAAEMFFTPEGLEQATGLDVARHRAERIASAHPERIGDLCCGIGGDLIALAETGNHVVGVDQDPLSVEVARANLTALDLTERAAVGMDDVRTHDRSAYDVVTLDPARRNRAGRVGDPAGHSPPWPFVLDLLGNANACVKAGPAIQHDRIPEDVEAEWVSVGGEVKEAALWSGKLATPVRRRATLLPAGVTLTGADDPGSAPKLAAQSYLYEPDGAVIRAGLVTAVAAQVEGGLLDPRIAYVTSDRLLPTPFATAYAVREVLPYDEKAIRAYMHAAKVGTVVVKKRGVDLVPEALHRKVRGEGLNTATLVITRIGRGAIAMICDPIGRAA